MEKLLLLHGAIGAKEQLTPLLQQLQGQFEVHVINFSGHGGEAIRSDSFSIELFADDVLKWMKGKKIEKVHIFGYSMGGYVALYLAKHFPEKVSKVFTLATKFAWDAETAQKEIKMLDPEKISEKIPAFAETLKKRHDPVDWRQVLKQTAEMMMVLGRTSALKEQDVEAIEQEVMVGVGDKDNMVTIEETVGIYRKLKNAKLVVMPGTPHPIERIPLKRLANEIQAFFSNQQR